MRGEYHQLQNQNGGKGLGHGSHQEAGVASDGHRKLEVGVAVLHEQGGAVEVASLVFGL
ncbi:hypothetical protein MUN79_01470 [Hymenobacter cellulosilyticus]|uniref:Uncharacterized protein n=1 Tax=Hymenobacter cellulosilyticus TaxID=2932248 RepID=A0A8T9Q6W9_9BACT|nr:hypothetical protein [Hymenobacter cellulosilyticus]UOQ72692.1 hypothetical protein MUN79_01470 [Hymenobacter cellulosilyticus]